MRQWNKEKEKEFGEFYKEEKKEFRKYKNIYNNN